LAIRFEIGGRVKAGEKTITKPQCLRRPDRGAQALSKIIGIHDRNKLKLRFGDDGDIRTILHVEEYHCAPETLVGYKIAGFRLQLAYGGVEKLRQYPSLIERLPALSVS
jgi:hypothetical protein